MSAAWSVNDAIQAFQSLPGCLQLLIGIWCCWRSISTPNRMTTCFGWRRQFGISNS